MATRPNILILMTDEHSPQWSGPYGNRRVQTPALDQLASAGVTMDNAYCNSPLCVPSRMSFMTGRYVYRVGAWDNGAVLPSDAVTWAHRFAAAG
jgi:choline-sulfatase